MALYGGALKNLLASLTPEEPKEGRPNSRQRSKATACFPRFWANVWCCACRCVTTRSGSLEHPPDYCGCATWCDREKRSIWINPKFSSYRRRCRKWSHSRSRNTQCFPVNQLVLTSRVTEIILCLEPKVKYSFVILVGYFTYSEW